MTAFSEEYVVGILRQFGMLPEGLELIRRKWNREVWRIKAESGLYALKFVNNCQKANMIAAVNDYLYRKGLPVIPVVSAMDGSPLVQVKDGCFLLFPWKEGKRPSYKKKGMVERLAVLLAQFHEASRGYTASGGPVTDRKLDLNDVYNKKIKKFEKYRKKAFRIDTPFSRVFIHHYPWIRARAEWAIDQLRHSKVNELIDGLRREPLLSHGDYSRRNLLINDKGELTLIDMDTVGLALPLRDISHLISWINYDLKSWSAGIFDQVLNAYQQIRQISEYEMEVLLIDQVFPNKAFRLTKRYFVEGDALLEEFERSIAIDREKLAELGIGPQFIK